MVAIPFAPFCVFMVFVLTKNICNTYGVTHSPAPVRACPPLNKNRARQSLIQPYPDKFQPELKKAGQYPASFPAHKQAYCLMPMAIPIARNFSLTVSSLSLFLSTSILPSPEMKPSRRDISSAAGSEKFMAMAPLAPIVTV